MLSLNKTSAARDRSHLSSKVMIAALSLFLLAIPKGHAATVSSYDNIKKVQESLQDKGYLPGKADGILGPKTQAALRDFQKDEKLEVTGRLDAATADKLGAKPESTAGDFKGAGKEVKEGAEEAGHEMKEGKPLAAGKELGKGVGRMGREVGKGLKKAVDPDNDQDRQEKKKAKE